MAQAPKLANGLTAKQEMFCLEIIKGANASEAYRAVYNCGKMKQESIWRKAKELSDNVKVTARIAELKRPVIEKAQITYEGHLEELQRLKDLALSGSNVNAAIRAEELRGKAAGFYKERVEHTGADGAPLFDHSNLVRCAELILEGNNGAPQR